MFAGGDALAARLDADQFHLRLIEKTLEDAHGVGAAADAGIDPVRHAAVLREDLFSGLHADDRLEPGHHLRKGMRTADRADDVMGVVHGGDPVAEGLVHGILKGAGAIGDRHDRGAELLHPEDIGPLAGDILLAHVDGAGKAETGGHGGGGHAMLAGAGLGDHPFFAHPFDQQSLAHDVIGLVGAGVVEILAFDVDLGATQMTGQVFRIGQRRGPAGIVAHEIDILLPE